ncbi:hypothetical protein MC885_019685 [Smutsia gigantea]|nr:hypothetical protein MC885_019685 [Smutsia gigantea]
MPESPTEASPPSSLVPVGSSACPREAETHFASARHPEIDRELCSRADAADWPPRSPAPAPGHAWLVRSPSACALVPAHYTLPGGGECPPLFEVPLLKKKKMSNTMHASDLL